MRMKNYQAALLDLNHAIELRPDYAHALMNRGDIYNYYYSIDRKKAMEDYDEVLKLVPPEEYNELSLCGHRLLAKNNGWNLNVFLTVIKNGVNAECK